MAQWNEVHPGSSERIARVLLPDVPSIDANEITDKGHFVGAQQPPVISKKSLCYVDSCHLRVSDPRLYTVSGLDRDTQIGWNDIVETSIPVFMAVNGVSHVARSGA